MLLHHDVYPNSHVAIILFISGVHSRAPVSPVSKQSGFYKALWSWVKTAWNFCKDLFTDTFFPLSLLFHAVKL